jgi:hypothetical protein
LTDKSYGIQKKGAICIKRIYRFFTKFSLCGFRITSKHPTEAMRFNGKVGSFTIGNRAERINIQVERI